jgi:uncharacterized membrane protein
MNRQINVKTGLKTKRFLGAATACAAAFAVAGCNQNLGHPNPNSVNSGNFQNAAASAAAGGLDFATVSKQVFQPHCLKCHASDVAKGDVVLDVYQSAFLIRADLRKSVESDKMPRKAAPLSPELKALLFAWIDSGAPEK